MDRMFDPGIEDPQITLSIPDFGCYFILEQLFEALRSSTQLQMTITVDLSCSKKNITSVCVNSLGDGIQIEEIIIRPNELKPATVVFTKPTYGGGFEVYYKVLKCKTNKEFDDSHYRTFHLSVYHYKNRVVSANSFVEVTLATPWECACLGKNHSKCWICQYCYQNKAKDWLAGLAMIPALGLPFGVASAVLAWGQSISSNEVHFSAHNLFTAVFETFLCAVEIASIGYLVGIATRMLVSLVRAGKQVTIQLLHTCLEHTVRYASEHAACVWAEVSVEFGHILHRCTSAGRVQYRKLLIETQKLKKH